MPLLLERPFNDFYDGFVLDMDRCWGLAPLWRASCLLDLIIYTQY
jgi:hypothetical protein